MPTFTDEQLTAYIETDEVAMAFITLIMAHHKRVATRQHVPQWTEALGRALAETLCDGDDGGTYQDYLESRLVEMDPDMITEVLDRPDDFVLTGVQGVVANVVAEVQRLELMDRDDWAHEAREIARDAAIQSRIDRDRGK